MDKEFGSFTWDINKEMSNIKKHKVDFITAAQAFKDTKRKIYIDSKHNEKEERFFCLGKIYDEILTVRFTYRGDKIRIYGAGFWRKEERYYYEKE